MLFVVGVLKVISRKGEDLELDQDPSVRVTDQRIRIRTKMSRIWNSVYN
jgi:hypothetical protein